MISPLSRFFFLHSSNKRKANYLGWNDNKGDPIAQCYFPYILFSSMKASDEKGDNKGLLKAELEGIFGKPKPNVVSVA